MLNETEVIPKQSKIVGTITSATAARAQHNGMPGTLNVSLQTLVFPDGRSTNIYGFLDINPAMLSKIKGSPSALSGPISGLGTTFRSVFTGLNSKAGIPLRLPKRTGGLDFKLDKGELLPVKLNRPLDLTNMPIAAAGSSVSPGMPAPYMTPNSVPGMSQTGYGGQQGYGGVQQAYGGASQGYGGGSQGYGGVQQAYGGGSQSYIGGQQGYGGGSQGYSGGQQGYGGGSQGYSGGQQGYGGGSQSYSGGQQGFGGGSQGYGSGSQGFGGGPQNYAGASQGNYGFAPQPVAQHATAGLLPGLTVPTSALAGPEPF
jgi:hypothetical protein